MTPQQAELAFQIIIDAISENTVKENIGKGNVELSCEALTLSIKALVLRQMLCKRDLSLFHNVDSFTPVIKKRILKALKMQDELVKILKPLTKSKQ